MSKQQATCTYFQDSSIGTTVQQCYNRANNSAAPARSQSVTFANGGKRVYEAGAQIECCGMCARRIKRLRPSFAV